MARLVLIHPAPSFVPLDRPISCGHTKGTRAASLRKTDRGQTLDAGGGGGRQKTALLSWCIQQRGGGEGASRTTLPEVLVVKAPYVYEMVLVANTSSTWKVTE